MARLTEEMIIARSRVSDIAAVKKLNFWGGDLNDVSIVRRMHSLEVLAISVNKVSSLEDLQGLNSLKELYVRNNHISRLNQICYLQDLPLLRVLWLAENPCANEPQYRLTVLKALPHLTKLDDVPVHPEEVEDALRKGRDLVHPENEPERSPSPPEVQQPQRVSPQRAPQPVQYVEEDRYVQPSRPARPPSDYEVQRVPASYQPEPEEEDVRYTQPYQARRPSDLAYQAATVPSVTENGNSWSPASSTPARADSPTATTYVINNLNNTPTYPSQGDRRDRRGSSASSNGSNRSTRSHTESPPGRPAPAAPPSVDDYAAYLSPRDPPAVYRQQERPPPPEEVPYVNGHGHDRRWTEPPRRTATATNLITAVLCLLMELDYEELVQVERTVRRRKQEMLQHQHHSP